jgi:Icc-related predicted phosphoesterase
MAPMRVLPLSDLHFEFHADGGKEFVESLDPRGVDLLVLAGDIGRMDVGIDKMLALFRKRFGCPIVFVHGNHEFFFSSRPAVLRATKNAVSKLRGVHWLDNEVVEIGGHRILGTTLWYGRARAPKDPLLVSTDDDWTRGLVRKVTEKGIVDWTYPDFEIAGFLDWVYEEHERSLRFLRDNLRQGDIVVSHFLPMQQSVPMRFAGSLTGCWFVTDVEPLIAERQPALWIHGHTHESSDYHFGPTRVVCNPLGYVTLGQRDDRNDLHFDPRHIIEVEPRQQIESVTDAAP